MNTRYLALAALVATGGAVSTLPAGAMPGDSAKVVSCQDIWVLRNQIYKDHGYCFKTTRARNYFGNGGCWVDDESDVGLSSKKMKLVLKYKHWETVKGC
ncbi:MAG: YARHG domain-containing protein [Hyphomicrobium sp.]